ncbi:hypothetical protein DV738_g1335, partial [Chaetothyriales sp. CBS 135597]
MFDEIAATLLRPGVSEKQLSNEIHELGRQRHGVRTHWHKRVVRSGRNTLLPYEENPPDRILEEDDILFVDLGPVFEQWEADFGRTFVLGGGGTNKNKDPVKAKLQADLQPIWDTVKARFDADPDITGEQLYAAACEESRKAGWEFGGKHSGHLVGNFPHERIPNDKISLYITKGNGSRMRDTDKDGNKRFWILEIHLVDRERGVGSFMEQLLNIDS